MGLKLRLGLALSGLALSSMFGVNLLSGVKDYVDTTGNIMVDIADGIGMVSKGIEALEYYLDPGSVPTEDPLKPAADVPSPPLAGAPPINPSSPPTPAAGDTAGQPQVFCQKGKCYPYDPAKMKNPNLNLEAKPGMILTAPSPPQKNKKRRYSEDEDDEENNPKTRPSAKNKDRQELKTETTKLKPTLKSDSVNQIVLPKPTSDSPVGADPSLNSTTPMSHGTKKLISSIKNLLDRTSAVLVKFVH